MKLSRFSVGLLLAFIGLTLYFAELSYADDTLDGTWDLYSEVVKGPGKGEKTEHIVQITQDITNGRIDGKTLDSNEKQIGRLTGLVSRTLIEMTFSYKKEVLRSTLQLSPDGTFIGGIFRRMDGGEGILYGLKRESSAAQTSAQPPVQIPAQ